MGSYNYKLQTVTYTAKEVTEELGLPFGRNTLYKHLKQHGILNEDCSPNDYMRAGNLILCNEVNYYAGQRRTSTAYVPYFTDKGIDYLREVFTKAGIIKSNDDGE